MEKKLFNQEINIMKRLFDYKRGKVISEQASMNLQADPTQFIQQKPLNIDCIGLKSPETNKTITGINGETFKFFSNGRFADVKGQKGNYVCGNQANIVNLMYDSDPKAVKYFNMTPKPAAQQQQKTVFVANEKPPFKFQQKGENIRMMQEYLGMPKNLQTGNFYNRTEQAIKKMFPTYNRSTGVTQDMFDQITGVKQSQQRKTKNTSIIPTERTTQQPQTTVNAAAPTQTATNLVPNAQQTQPTRKQQRQANRLARR